MYPESITFSSVDWKKIGGAKRPYVTIEEHRKDHQQDETQMSYGWPSNRRSTCYRQGGQQR